MADTKDKKTSAGVKRRSRFNFIDMLIIMAFAVVAISVAFRYNLADKIGVTSEDDTVIISFLVQDIKEKSTDALVLGDMFYWELNGILIGELISKKPAFAEAFVENDEGILVKQYNENSYDVRGEIKAKGKIKDEGFMLGGRQFLAPGKVLYVQSRNIMVNMTITDITRSGS